MMFAVLFEDDATAPRCAASIWTSIDPSSPQRGAIHAAGPLVDARNSEPAGGLWLVEAQDLDAVRALYEQDPFWPTGLRKSVRVLEWRRVLADGQNLP